MTRDIHAASWSHALVCPKCGIGTADGEDGPRFDTRAAAKKAAAEHNDQEHGDIDVEIAYATVRCDHCDDPIRIGEDSRDYYGTQYHEACFDEVDEDG